VAGQSNSDVLSKLLGNYRSPIRTRDFEQGRVCNNTGSDQCDIPSLPDYIASFSRCKKLMVDDQALDDS